MGLIDADKFKQQVAGMVISMHYPAWQIMHTTVGRTLWRCRNDKWGVNRRQLRRMQ